MAGFGHESLSLGTRFHIGNNSSDSPYSCCMSIEVIVLVAISRLVIISTSMAIWVVVVAVVTAISHHIMFIVAASSHVVDR